MNRPRLYFSLNQAQHRLRKYADRRELDVVQRFLDTVIQRVDIGEL